MINPGKRFRSKKGTQLNNDPIELKKQYLKNTVPQRNTDPRNIEEDVIEVNQSHVTKAYKKVLSIVLLFNYKLYET